MVSEPILIVDDSPANLKLARVVFHLALDAEGYRVVEAPHAAAALAWTKQGLPALVLVDLVLPDMSGNDLAHALRGSPGGAELPIVAVSGFPGLAGDGRAPLGEF